MAPSGLRGPSWGLRPPGTRAGAAGVGVTLLVIPGPLTAMERVIQEWDVANYSIGHNSQMSNFRPLPRAM